MAGPGCQRLASHPGSYTEPCDNLPSQRFLGPRGVSRNAKRELQYPITRAGLSADADMREGAKKPEDVQEPQHDDDHYDGVQNRLDRSLHWYVAVDEPKQNSHDNQYDHDIYQRHERPPLL